VAVPHRRAQPASHCAPPARSHRAATALALGRVAPLALLHILSPMLGLLVVDHGSRRAEANAQLEDIAERLRRLRPDDVVAHAHLEVCEPTIMQAVARLVADGAVRIAVLPYFLSEGRHSREDIPRLVAAAAAAYPQVTVTIAPALGPDDALARLLIERSGLE
jgi:sirohydrochlorin ferrochelatase